jgi:hypothetical protein
LNKRAQVAAPLRALLNKWTQAIAPSAEKDPCRWSASDTIFGLRAPFTSLLGSVHISGT